MCPSKAVSIDTIAALEIPNGNMEETLLNEGFPKKMSTSELPPAEG